MAKTGRYIIAALSIIVIAGCSLKGGELMNREICLKRYNISRDTSPWSGLTASFKEEEESKKIRALSLKGSDYKPVPSLEKYSKSGSHIVGVSMKLKRVAVEKSLFSDLNRADATKTTDGKFRIGIFKDLTFEKLSPADIAEFLLESQIINTLWHVESDICFVKEENSASSYKALYTGKHYFYTNQRNESPLDFSIIIEKNTGEIFLEAR